MHKAVCVAGVALILATAACSSGDVQRSSEDLQTMDVREESVAPGVDVTAAPGVAFNYRYAFRLPSNRIAATQEAHAQACERLGLERCRITGMRYRLVNQTDIQAMLALRLDPAIARGFGKQATEIVTKADGMLVDQEITGEDVGTQIKTATTNVARLRADLAQIERELAAMRANDPRRGELVARAEEIRTQIRSLTETRDAGEEALAGTPMVFNYGSGSVVPGFDVRSPIRDAIENAGNNFVDGFATILVLLITLIPWALLLALVVWLVNWSRRRWNWGANGYRGDSPEAEPAQTAPRRRTKREPA